MANRNPTDMGGAFAGVPMCSRERCASYDGKRCRETGNEPGEVCVPEVRSIKRLSDFVRAQQDATIVAIRSDCVEHVELNGHLDIVEQCCDYLDHEAMDSGDPSGKLRDFSASLRIVAEQIDRQRRRANWYEAAHARAEDAEASASALRAVVSAIEPRVVEAIAAWLERRAVRWMDRGEGAMAGVADGIAVQLRNGEWRKS